MDDSSAADDNDVSVIVFAVVYGILLIVVIGHCIVRACLHRRQLNTWQPHVPGDKSFKNKCMRQQITRDFDTIRNVPSDPRLIDNTLNPSVYGDNKGNEPPCHWYRMKAFDNSSDFVTSHINLLGPTHPAPSVTSLALPMFISELKRLDVISETHYDAVSRATDLYNAARYSTKEFTPIDLNDLLLQLNMLRQHLSSRGTHSLAPQRFSTISVSSASTPITPDPARWHDKASARLSSEPLIEGVRTRVATGKHDPSAQAPRTHRDIKGRSADLELPLLVACDPYSASSTPRTSRVWPNTSQV